MTKKQRQQLRLLLWKRNAELLRCILPCGCLLVLHDGLWWYTFSESCGKAKRSGEPTRHWSVTQEHVPPAVIAAAYAMALRDIRGSK
jgi:hypothetical protein